MLRGNSRKLMGKPPNGPKDVLISHIDEGSGKGWINNSQARDEDREALRRFYERSPWLKTQNKEKKDNGNK